MYNQHLARIHHDHFGRVARAAATVAKRVPRPSQRDPKIIDLACGSGIFSGAFGEFDPEVIGYDISQSMLELASTHVPTATFVQESLWTALRNHRSASADLIAAVGEAFCYRTPAQEMVVGCTSSSTLAQSAQSPSLRRIVGECWHVLKPGGALIFDVASPGRSGPKGRREVEWSIEGIHLRMREVETSLPPTLHREIEIEWAGPTGLETHVERHTLETYPPKTVVEALEAAGFSDVMVLPSGQFANDDGPSQGAPTPYTHALVGWTGFLARR